MKEACDNTLLIAERCEVSFTEGNGTYMPRFPVPGGRDRGDLVPPGGRDGPAPPLPRRHPRRRSASGPTSRSASSSRWASPATSWSSPTSSTGPRTTASGSAPGRGSGAGSIVRLRDADHRPRPARARPDLRALPQPRARLDARLRHRLRRASARRGDPLRHREVRRGPRLDDRHLRHDQGQAGGQGLQPDPRLPVRDGRPDHQGDAGGGDGQGHPAQGDLRPAAQALRRGRRVPHALRRRPRRQDGRRHRDRPRGPQAPVGCPRGRRDHVERAADRHHPDDAAPAGRRDHHPVRLPDVRAARPDQDGLPGAAQPHGPRRRARSTSRPTAARRSSSRTSPLDDAADLRAARRAATRSASSSSTAARCAALLRLDAARQLRRHLARSLALYRPGPMGADSHNKYARRKNRPQADRADPPRARRAARRDPRARPTA